jgi:hypothetical protein
MTLDNEERRFRAAVAAMAQLAGVIAKHEIDTECRIIQNRPQSVAELAVLYADTLLGELDKTKKKCEHHRTIGYVHCTDVTCQDCGLKFKQWREGDTVVRDFE